MYSSLKKYLFIMFLNTLPIAFSMESNPFNKNIRVPYTTAIYKGDKVLALNKFQIKQINDLVRSFISFSENTSQSQTTPSLYDNDSKVSKSEDTPSIIYDYSHENSTTDKKETELIFEQIEDALAVKALTICQETLCGNQPCKDVHKFKYLVDSSGNYYFTKLQCLKDAKKLPALNKNLTYTQLEFECHKISDLSSSVNGPNDNNANCETESENLKSKKGWFSSIGSMASSVKNTAKSYLKPIMNACSASTVSRVSRDVGCAILDDITKNSSPSDFFNPLQWGGRILTAAAKAAISSAVVNSINNYTNSSDSINIEAIIEKAQMHLEIGQKNKTLATKQVEIIQKWLRQAQELAGNYAGEKEKILEQINDPAKLIASAADKIEEKPQVTEVKAQAPNLLAEYNIPYYQRIAQEKAAKEKKELEEKEKLEKEKLAKKATNKAYVESLLKAAKGRRPERKTLEKENPELLGLLDALKAFTEKIPVHKSTIERSQVDKNIEENPALGNKSLVNELKNWAYTISDNARGPQLKQDKKFIIAAGEPGTGKTTGIKLASSWANIPTAIITGEDFQKLKIEPDDVNKKITPAWDAYKAILVESILAATITKVDSEGKEYQQKVVTTTILHDDFHFALMKDSGNNFGYLNKAIAPLSRTLYNNVYKNLADAAIETIEGLEIELAKGKFLPIFVGGVNLAKTLNELPDDFNPEKNTNAAMSSTLSRMIALPKEGPDADDRKDFALSFIKKIQSEVKILYPDQADTLNLNECRERLLEVIQKDIEMYNKANKSLGVRGTVTLLGGYFEHVRSKLRGSKLDPMVCSFNGIPELEIIPYDIEAKASIIGDYKKMVSADLAQVDKIDNILKEIDIFRATYDGKVNSREKKYLDDLLIKASTRGVTFENRKSSLESAKNYFMYYCRRVIIPEKDDVGKLLLANFGHLHSSGETNIQENKRLKDVNRFDQLVALTESIYTNIMLLRDADLNEEIKIPKNKLVQVNYTHSAGSDPLFFLNFAKIFGDVPVLEVNSPKQVFHNFGKKPKLRVLTEAIAPIHEATMKKFNSTFDNITYKFIEHSSTASLQRHTFDNNTVIYYFSIKVNGSLKYFIIKEDSFAKISELVTKSDKNDYVNLSKEFVADAFIMIDEPRSNYALESKIDELTKSKIIVFDTYVDELMNKLSLKEGFLVIHLTNPLVEEIVNWASAQNISKNNSHQIFSPKIAIDKFKEFLTNTINSNSHLLSNKTSLSFRGVTVFLNNEANYDLTNDEDMQILTFGIPPISGRKIRARALLESKLKYLQDQIRIRPYTVEERTKVLSEMQLNQEEKNLFELIIKLDEENASEYEMYMADPLPMIPLENAVDSLINRIKSRNNLFKLNLGVQKSVNMMGAIEEHYGLYKEDSQREKKRIEEAKEFKKIEEQEQKKRLEEKELKKKKKQAKLDAQERLSQTSKGKSKGKKESKIKEKKKDKDPFESSDSNSDSLND